MPSAYTMLWSHDYCQYLIKVDQVGQVLRFVWGGHNQDTRFSHMRVQQGDLIYPLAVREQQVYLVARMVVEQLLTRQAFVWLYPNRAHLIQHACASEIMLGEEGTPIRFDRALPPTLLEQIRFCSRRGTRPIKYVENGKLLGSISLQGVYRLCPESAQAFERLLQADARVGVS